MVDSPTADSPIEPDISHENPAQRKEWFGHPRQLARLFTTEAMQQVVDTLLDVVGADGLIAAGSPAAIEGGVFERAYRHAPLETITGGTSEIQRDIIATAGLGLPRSR